MKRADRRLSPGLTALLSATAGGDRAAFGRLYDDLAPQVYGWAKHLEPERAEDITSTVLLELWQCAPDLARRRCDIRQRALALTLGRLTSHPLPEVS